MRGLRFDSCVSLGYGREPVTSKKLSQQRCRTVGRMIESRAAKKTFSLHGFSKNSSSYETVERNNAGDYKGRVRGRIIIALGIRAWAKPMRKVWRRRRVVFDHDSPRRSRRQNERRLTWTIGIVSGVGPSSELPPESWEKTKRENLETAGISPR